MTLKNDTMKQNLKFVMTAAGAAAVLALGACTNRYSAANPGEEMFASKARIDSVSYAFGMVAGSQLKGAQFGEVNLDQVMAGMKDVLFEKEVRIPENEINQIISSYLMERQSFLSDKNLADGQAFLEKNKTAENVQVTETGLQFRILEAGNGVFAKNDRDTVEVHYTGKLLDGTVFDSSEERGEPIRFPLNMVVKGWSEGLKKIDEGGRIELFIPAELGYGAQTYGPIPGNSVLHFEVKLLKVYPYVEKTEKKK